METKNKIPNKEAICNALVEAAADDKDIIVLCSDSRGSASFGKFINTYPDQVIEVGIAEQDLVGVSAGLARCGKKAFAVSPACFLTARSIEQVKLDVCYSHTNVKLLGISGGISYGALGMSHHSAQDIAYTASLPGLRVYLPSDRFQSGWLAKVLLKDSDPAYIRVGRNAVEDVYSKEQQFELNKAVMVRNGTDVVIIACGEMVQQAAKAADDLAQKGISCGVIDMYCLKPLDADIVISAAKEAKAVLTVEEHVSTGGLGSMVCQVLCQNGIAVKVACMSLPDEPVAAGAPALVLAGYGLCAEGIAEKCLELMA